MRSVTHNNKINDIEILRAVAVLLVILEHLHYLFPWLKAYDRFITNLSPLQNLAPPLDFSYGNTTKR